MRPYDRSINRRRALALGAGAGTAFALACGGSSNKGQDTGQSSQATTSAATTQAVQQSAPTQATGTPRQGGTFTFHGAAGDLPDVHQATHVGVLTHFQHAIDGLTQFDEPSPGDLREAPMLANVAEKPDDVTLLYKLRPGVKFANVPPVGGRPVTSEDAKFSLQRMATNDPKYVRRSWFAPVDRYETPDATTLKIVTKQPVAALSTLIANPWTGIIAKEQVDRDGAQLKDYIGSGPYVTARLDMNTQIDFKRNTNYWEQGKPYIDQFMILQIAEPAARVAAFRSGQLTRVDPPLETIKNFKQANPDAQEYKTLSGGIGIVAFNLRRDPYKDVRVRQAIASAVDLKGWIDAIYAGYGVLTGPMPTTYKNWALPEEKLPYAKPDLTKAKQLLTAAGLGSGLKLNAFSIADVPTYIAHAEQLKADLKQIGIDVQVEAVTQQDYVRRLFVQFDFDIVCGQDYAPDDPDRLRDKFHSKGSGNYAGYANAQLDELLDKQSATVNPAARKQLVDQAQQIILTDVPIIFTEVPYSFVYYKPNVRNARESVVAGNSVRWNARNAYFAQ